MWVKGIKKVDDNAGGRRAAFTTDKKTQRLELKKKIERENLASKFNV